MKTIPIPKTQQKYSYSQFQNNYLTRAYDHVLTLKSAFATKRLCEKYLGRQYFHVLKTTAFCVRI